MTIKRSGDGSSIVSGPDGVNIGSSAKEPLVRTRLPGDAYDRFVQYIDGSSFTGDGTVPPAVVPGSGTFVTLAGPWAHAYTEGVATDSLVKLQSSDATKAPFVVGIQSYANPGPATDYNTVLRVGYNADGSKGSEPVWRDTWEMNWDPDGLGTRWLERYVEYVDGAVTKRPWMVIVNKATKAIFSWTILVGAANGLQINDEADGVSSIAQFAPGSHLLDGRSAAANTVVTIRSATTQPELDFKTGSTLLAQLVGVNANRFDLIQGGRSNFTMFSYPTYAQLVLGRLGGPDGSGVFRVDLKDMTAVVVGINVVQRQTPPDNRADLIRWSAYDESVYSRVSYLGYFMTSKNAAPLDADVNTGEMAVWFDKTAGAAKAMFKAKNASGAVVTGSLALA